MTQLIVRYTSMSINNYLLAKVPVWQGVFGRNRLNSHSAPRPPHPRAASFLTAVSKANS